ncbi:MAG TPA: AzlD domain-containing protein [Alphaproteobacteria bacterium]|nr:AzlD domain-containing protein [Alphaproteobacteria bacterium]
MTAAEAAGWYPWAALAIAAAATYLSRFLGVALSGRIRPEGALFQWVGCVAYALLAGLIARMIVLPVGPLAETSLPARLAACALALAVFFALRHNFLAGVAAGGATLMLIVGAGWF